MISDFYNISISNVKKLVPVFFDKEQYVLDFENLQLHLRLGLKFKKVHGIRIRKSVLEFDQLQWLKAYVEFNTQKRIDAVKMTTKIEKRCTS